MAKLSITEAWNETTTFVRREGQLLFPLTFLLIGVPGAVLQMMLPQQPEAAAEASLGWFWLGFPIVMLLSFYAYLVLCRMAVTGGDSGEAFSTALRRLPALIGAALITFLGLLLIAVPLIFLLGGAAVLQGGGSAEAMAGTVLIAALVIFVVAVLIGTRLVLTNPVAANEPVGPIEILRRSWRLTGGHFWKLLGFLVLVFVLFAVASMAVGAVLGLIIIAIAGQPEPGSVASFLVLLVGAAVNTVFVVFFAGLVSRIYVQLAGRGKDVAEVF